MSALAPRLTFPPLSAVESPLSPCFYTFSKHFIFTTRTYTLLTITRSSPAVESPLSPCFYTFSTQEYGLTTKTYKLYASRSSPAVESPLSPCFNNPSILREGNPATPNGAVLGQYGNFCPRSQFLKRQDIQRKHLNRTDLSG